MFICLDQAIDKYIILYYHRARTRWYYTKIPILSEDMFYQRLTVSVQ